MSWNQTIFSSGADRKQLKPIPSERIKKIERSKTDNQPKLTMILLCFHDITSLHLCIPYFCITFLTDLVES